ncbi:DNA-directed RNA polymerase specialized sigma subunit, sigma24 [Desulfosporosinus acidiphilus SJ4]|uniref:DNA-directed RNA polymerase specialized sigma subunit, sigma24 n=1 Tax=Desulfosporosinus acidiphilus (strain DSM 22704 / JCM 16185 / SJ4) TaxID=646529 RepID=I4D3M4_DESAJ|nr:sigma factor-like helix-turn-helix DNA-binding protein [Desulfosporosinus acidiphilus]AFM40398.1 DNA-directed RNA polymerase specialized sigma subunit, sigma24 [Desulfosporosinus acidiphilus SJ4]
MQPEILSQHASGLDELEIAINYLRQCQSDLKRQPYDLQRAQLIKEWLIDLYILRKHHPEYKPDLEKRVHYQNTNDEILLSDPELINVKAKIEFLDPFEMKDEWHESAMVRELMDGLTIMEYEAVTMCWLNGLGPTEAAQYMGCSARNISTYLIRARTKMVAKYLNSSQMVLSGFDVPPTVRSHHHKKSPLQLNMAKKQAQLTLF